MEDKSPLGCLIFALQQIPAVLLLLLSGWFNATAAGYIWNLGPTAQVLAYGSSGLLTVGLLLMHFWPRCEVRHTARWITAALLLPFIGLGIGESILFLVWIPPLALFSCLILMVVASLVWAMVVVDMSDRDGPAPATGRLRRVEWVPAHGQFLPTPVEPRSAWDPDPAPPSHVSHRASSGTYRSGRWQFAPSHSRSVPSRHTVADRRADDEDWQGEDQRRWDDCGW